MRSLSRLIILLTTACLAALPLAAAQISPIGVDLLQSVAFYPADNLIDGEVGNPANLNTWVTDAPNGGMGDYFDKTVATPAPDPLFVFDLGADIAIDSVLTWPYTVGGNSAKDFSLRFATEADGNNGFGTSIPDNPSLVAPATPATEPGISYLGRIITARYVEMRITDNYLEDYAGGDRVGLGEVAFFEANTPLQVVTQPVGASVDAGNAFSLFASVQGSDPIAFQWRRDGIDVNGATSSTYAVQSAQLNHNGIYDLLAANGAGSVTTETATVTVAFPLPHPTGQGVLQGETAIFSTPVIADSYQWKLGGVNVAGATEAVLTLAGVTPAQAGAYTVTVTIGVDTFTSGPATLSVLSPAGRSDYELTILADTPRAYWRLGEASGTTATDQTGFHDGLYLNTPTLGSTGVVAGDPDTAAGFIQGNQTMVEVPYSPDLNPASYTVEVWAKVTGGNGHRSPITSRDDNPQAGYVLYASPGNLWECWTGPGPTPIAGNAVWDVMLGNPVQVETWEHIVTTYDADTRVKTLFINGDVVSSRPVVTTVNPNLQQVLRIGAGATDDPVGQFFFHGPIDEVAVYGAALPLDRVRTHYLTALYGGNSPPFIDTQPEDQLLILGETNAVVTFTTTVNGSPPMDLVWDKDGTPVPGANNTVLVIPNAVPADAGTYTLTANNTLGSVASDPADLILSAGQIMPLTQAVLNGGDASFSITMPADSTGYTYQWLLEDTPIPGATEASLDLTGVQTSDTGEITVEVTLGALTATSLPAELMVAAAPTRSYDAAVSASLPLVWYRLGEVAGSSVANDEMLANPAVYMAAAAPGAPGALLGDANTAVSLNGTAESRVELGFTFPDLYLPTFSVEFWAKSTGGSGLRSPITQRWVEPTGEKQGWSFYANAANRWQFETGDSSTTWNILQGPPVSPDAWTHVVGSYEASTLTMTLYVNGSSVGQLTNVAFTPQDFTSLWIGAGGTENPINPIYRWVGSLDEVAIYNRTLTVLEVLEHYAAAFPADAPPEITEHPAFAWALPGDPAAFSGAARGYPPLSYQWQKDAVDLTGATDTNLVFASAQSSDTGLYRLVAANGAGSVTSQTAELYVPSELTGAYGDLVLADGPIAYWPLDELSGTTAIDSAGINNGTYSDGVTLGQEPAITQGLGSGTSAGFAGPNSGEKVEVPYSSVLNPAQFTIETWARVAANTSWYRSVLTSRNDNPQQGYIFYAAANNNWEFWSGTGEQVGWVSLGGGPAVVGEWAHLVGTYDGTNKTFYVNGQLMGSQVTVIAPNDARPLRIASGATDADPGDFWFPGLVDEVAIYNYPLSPKQIISHYAAGLPVDLPMIDAGRLGDMMILQWDEGILQQSTNLLMDTWLDVPGSPTSPYPVVPTLPANHYRILK